MKLIDVVPAVHVIIAATIFVVAGSTNAQQIGSVQEGRQLRPGVARWADKVRLTSLIVSVMAR
jgi:hypothetical protein